jgi:predicted dehydrogenase/nucleoside-diphosphate-sugar epimerase
MGVQHLRAIARVPGARVVAIADPLITPDRLGNDLPAGVQLLRTPEQLLEEVRPDIVHIVTPPRTHMALACRAIEAGCHAYVEKPFALSTADARRILELAARRGVKVCAGHQLMYEAPARRLRESLSTLGELVHAESRVAFRMVRRNITPVDQVKDILPHAVYLLLGSLDTEAPVDIVGVETRADGDVHARIRVGNVTGTVWLTLKGRPIEQRVNIVGTNGSVTADFVTGGVVRVVGPGNSPVSVLLKPYSEARQVVAGTTRGFAARFRRSNLSYPGLPDLFGQFYRHARLGAPAPMSQKSILDTVVVCERIGSCLDASEETAEQQARARLQLESEALPIRARGRVLLTGGSGFLGRRVAVELRTAGFDVRSVSRSRVPHQSRLPGVEYVQADLSTPLDAAVLSGVHSVVHCAAETAGDVAEHRANSVTATANLLTAAADAGVRAFVHVSSVAVLKPGGRRPINEQTPLDAGNFERGPYVWGKAEAELVARRTGDELRLPVKIVRPGPLVDYESFQPPGRLGRELGPWYAAVGPRNGRLAVCDVGTAARVLRWYVQEFESAPEVLNLLEDPTPRRRELMARFTQRRPDLRVFWVPGIVLRLASPVLKLAQRILVRGRTPLDIYAAFASERYDAALAARTIQEIASTSSNPPSDGAENPVGLTPLQDRPGAAGRARREVLATLDQLQKR